MKIGIFGAEEQEINLLQEKINGEKKIIAGAVFYSGQLNGIDVVISCGGIGKVCAAFSTQILISEFNTDLIINTGIAGSTDKTLNIFDIVVSNDAVQHDVDATFFGYAKGQVPKTKSPFWKADEKLISAAIKAFDSMKKEKDFENLTQIKIKEGRIASGDVFVANENLKNEIVKNFSPLCVEMEGAAVAQTCTANGIPFIILRCISDPADKENSEMISYEAFSKKAAQISSNLVLNLLKVLKLEQ